MPYGWRAVNLGHVATVGTGSADVQDSQPNGIYPFVVRSPKLLKLGNYTHDTEAVLTAGDGNVGEIFHHLKGKFAAHQRVYVIEPGRNLYGRFLYYVMRGSFLNSLQGNTAKSTVESLRRPMLTGFSIPLPPVRVQQRIADYLDHETAEIDEFINYQTSLLKFLDEKIEAQITTSTSRGFDNHEATGNHWYPELGAGWKIGQVKSLSLKLTDGAHISPVTENGTYPFVSTKDVKRGKIDTINCLHTDASSAEYMIRTGCKPESGDVLFSKDGTVGESAIVGPHLDFVVASSLVIIRPNPKLITPSFLRMTLLARPVREQARAFMKGAGLPRISVANVGRLITPIPSLAEQQRIAVYLDDQIRQADSLREDVLHLIDLARERRAALITAAVTGQVDVTARNKPAAEQLEDDIAQGLHREN
ncbi:restriction endonuclease subunit S [Kocuria salsicia]|uniref:restriction endonuclease subunit S n=1 Tax=Kocuria salsicia TaxID=664639 RepID=UPI0018DEA9AD|nr:restriction endonuclease subunit S [Kocuria salsicia]